jgi:hypothetical protein
LLGVFEIEIGDLGAGREEGVEKVLEQVFAGFFAKDFFETEVSVGVDVAGAHGLILGAC